ncbi:MAG: ABC transporter ATP-binding protein [SAR324 cluster bacterium]|nr:ABC transporter ATP-binding protein [SAR324 cluster bacterium]
MAQRAQSAKARTAKAKISGGKNKPAPLSKRDNILEVEGLKTYFFTREGEVRAVDDVSIELERSDTLGIVGESGCGKSVTSLSILRLVPDPPGKIVGGKLRLEGVDLMGLSDKRMQSIRGNDISMIFQEPMTSLNPVLTIGHQISEAVVLHQGLSHKEAMNKAVEMLELVKIPEALLRVKEYPHQLSGGMRQRAMIAMALSCTPKVLIADEPTTALDVTIQAQILDLIGELQEQLGTAVILITHDLGVIAEPAGRVVVMYAGKKVEDAEVGPLFAEPLHPYTHGLMASVPRLDIVRGVGDQATRRLTEIPGIVPPLTNLPPGCTFAPRCSFADDQCTKEFPPYEHKGGGHWVACWHSDKLYGGK